MPRANSRPGGGTPSPINPCSATVLVTHSVLSADFALAVAEKDYGLSARTATFLHFGLNDTYCVETTAGDRYYLRIYRFGWRTPDDIAFEIEAINAIAAAGCPAACALRRREGEWFGRVVAPEGTRFVALFAHAPGKDPDYSDEAAQARAYGAHAAAVHAASSAFVSMRRRFSLDLDHLLDRPMSRIISRLAHRPADQAYLNGLVQRLRERFGALSPGLDHGFCHGDFHGGNAHIDERGVVTFFDFDCCGPGHRAYDLAVFRWGARLAGKEAGRWPPFLDGYRGVRALSDADIAATDLYVGMRHVWLCGMHCEGAQSWGSGWQNDAYFARMLEFLRAWEKECFP